MSDIVRVNGSIYATLYARYSPKYKPIINNAELLNEAVTVLDDHFNTFKDRPRVLLKPMRKNCYGPIYTFGYLAPNKIIVLDPKFSINKLINTLSHECVHLDQMERGDLKYTKDCYGNLTGIIWKKKLYDSSYIFSSQTQNYESYLKFPWEIEARAKESDLEALVWSKCLKVIKKIGLVYGPLR